MLCNAKRTKRKGESLVKKATARLFYKLINKISDHEIPENVGDFRLMSRQAVDALNQVRERKRFMKGLFAWIGFPQTAIEYSRDPRLAGKTNWNYRETHQVCHRGHFIIYSGTLTPRYLYGFSYCVWRLCIRTLLYY